MGVGRFLCVALPFGLTIASIVFLLNGTLAGVTNKSLYMFQANMEDLSINPADAEHITDKLNLKIDIRAQDDNITAADLRLEKLYDISLWGYCYVDQNDKRHCNKPEFNWAAEALNTTYIENFGSAVGKDIELPKEIKKALKAYKTVTKWTQVAFILALVTLGLEIVCGIFANCTRVMSCITWVVAGFAFAFSFAASLMATIVSLVVVGALKGTAKWYGVKAKMNWTFLSVIWIGVAFSLAALIFWMCTICCCKPEHRSRNRNRNRDSDGEKLMSGPSAGSYAPISNEHDHGYYNHNQTQSQYGAPRYPSGAARSDLAYEPYSHRA